MQRATVQTQCDLCFIQGNFVKFTHRSGRDFCQWCMTGPVTRTECGGHVVDVADGSWSCSCGEVYGGLVIRLRTHGVSLAAMDLVPDLASATAAIHVQTPNWPKPY